MASEDPAQSMTDSARAKLQGVWTSLRSIKVDGEDMMESKVAMLTKWTPRPASSEDDKEGGGATALENVMRTMFASCTAFDPPSDDEKEESTSAAPSSPRRHRSRSSTRRRRSSSSHARAKQAVHSLREKAEQRQTSPSNRKPQVSRPFSRSATPSGRKNHGGNNGNLAYVLQEVQVAPPPPPPPPDLAAKTGTFDDGISAISAHTLEELDRQHQLKMLKKPLKFTAVHSDLTHDSDEEGFEALVPHAGSTESSLFMPAQSEGEERDCVGESVQMNDITTPIDVVRGRSNNTWGSKGVHTLSSESTDFENVWRQEEQKYWEETVERDQRKPKRGSSRSRKLRVVRKSSRESDMFALKQDATITTAGSTAFSSMGSSHPHDTIPIDPSDFVPVSVRSSRMAHDPDRIQDMIAVDAYTEIGEI